MAARKRMREQRREELISAAMRCIVKKGYTHVTVEDICKEVGMSRGIVSYHFKNKEELMVSVLEKMIEDSTEAIETFVGLSKGTSDDRQLYPAFQELISRQDPVELIKEGVKAIVQYIHEHQDTVYIFLEFLSQANRNKTIGELIAYLNKRYWDLGEMIVSEGIRRNIFRVKDPRVTVQLLIASGNGILLNSATDEKFFPLEERIEEITNLAMRYLGAE